MEYRPRFPAQITPVSDLKAYFDEYSSFVSLIAYPNTVRKSLSQYFAEKAGINEEDFDEMNLRFTKRVQSWKKIETTGVALPVKGFHPDFHNFSIPSNAKLKSLQFLRKTNENKKRTHCVRYRGQISCVRYVFNHLKHFCTIYCGEGIAAVFQDYLDGKEDDKKEKDRTDMSSFKLMKNYSDYLLKVRVYVPFNHSSKEVVKQAPHLLVHQEFLVYGQQGLTELKDRIVCTEDLRSAEGDVSLNPFATTKVTNQDVYRSSMFFIDDIFYVDLRQPGNIDYSVVIKEWAAWKGLTYRLTKRMESVSFQSLKLRLGYPYLFMHQGSCEHLIVFIDARLIGPNDIMKNSAYPIMTSYANLRPKHCQLCGKSTAKFIVTGMKYIPHRQAFLCGLCLFQYCYHEDGTKVCNFAVFKYVDRTAIF